MRLNTKIFSSVSTKSLMLGIVIVSACAAFVFTGFGSLNPGNLAGLDPNTIAQIGSEKIDVQRFSAAMRSQNISSTTPPEQRKAIAQQILNQMIQEKILIEQAKKIGWSVDQSEIASILKSSPYFQDPQTQQFDIKLLKGYINQNGMSETEFYAYLQQQIAIQKMQNLLFMPIVLPEKIIEVENQIKNEEFKIQYAVIKPSDAYLKNKISAQAHKYIEDKAQLQNLMTLFENSKNQYQQKAQVKSLSILVSYKTAQRAQGEALNRSKEEALSLAKQIESKLNSGADFSKLAVEKNDDLTAKSNKGDIGFVDDTRIDELSMKALLALTPAKPLSQVIDTPFGYRIFKFIDSKPAVVKKFDDVKFQLAEQFVSQQVQSSIEDEMQKNISEIIAAKNISNLNKVLAENNISWQYLNKPFKISDSYIPELGMTDELAANIFALKNPGDTLPKIINFGSKKAIIKLVSKTSAPSLTPELAQTLKNQILSTTTQEFMKSVQQSLNKKYEKDGSIKINTALIN
ncbi:SurA N-terminal domain-containing protein [Fluviispira vulneris]|uniref:SurA N-terminal domain-containing protein n=1 Tax=Fluviispira vulneris TaxID=2763012 RepID=UPI0016460F7A|nr:SurA N-terminal domain-containing protein [Fluviispira vulneris]